MAAWEKYGQLTLDRLVKKIAVKPENQISNFAALEHEK